MRRINREAKKMTRAALKLRILRRMFQRSAQAFAAQSRPEFVVRVMPASKMSLTARHVLSHQRVGLASQINPAAAHAGTRRLAGSGKCSGQVRAACFREVSAPGPTASGTRMLAIGPFQA
jgi:hypothetical protein